jgi:hypothetical protein
LTCATVPPLWYNGHKGNNNANTLQPSVVLQGPSWWFLCLLGLGHTAGAGDGSTRLNTRLGGTATKAKAWTTLVKASCLQGTLTLRWSLIVLTKWSEAESQLLTATGSELVAWNSSATSPVSVSTLNESCSSHFRNLCNRFQTMV